MKKIFTMLILGATLEVLSAQAQTETEVVTHTVAESESNNASALMDDVMQSAIKAKNDEIADLKRQVQALEDSIRKQQQTVQHLLKNIKSANRQREDEAAAIEKAKADMDTKLAEMQQKVEAADTRRNELEEILKRFDTKIYKQCLLYPLERRYDSNFIEEALLAIDDFQRFNSTPSKKFEEYKRTYEPLLKMYEKYNNELIACIEKHRKMFKMTKGVIEPDHRQRCAQELHSLPYYKACYVGRNNPPYKSILYLDDIIEEYEKLLNSNGNVLDRIEDILSRLRPKQVQPEPVPSEPAGE